MKRCRLRRSCLGVLFLGLGLMGCVRQPSAINGPEEAATVSASHIEVDTSALGLPDTKPNETVERAGIRRVLQGAGAAATTCYGAALSRMPDLHGEVIVRFAIDADGQAKDVTTSLTTIGDLEMVQCVEQVVSQLAFPVPSKASLTVRYPFVFTSDRTPPEVTRTLLTRYGLLEEEESGSDFTLEDESPPTEGTYQTW